jgi:hypothetical protein
LINLNFYNGADKSLVVTLEKNTHLTKFGFRFNRGGTHLSHTMMLEDLSNLLGYINDPNADKKDYLKAIKADNCLGKRSGKTRELTSRHLVGLYSLDTADILFRTLLFFWHRGLAGLVRAQDNHGHPIDPKDLDRKSVGKILFKVESTTVTTAQRIDTRMKNWERLKHLATHVQEMD